MSKSIVRYLQERKNMNLFIQYAQSRDESINIPDALKDHFHDLEMLHDWFNKFREHKTVLDMYLRKKADAGTPLHKSTAYRHLKQMKLVFAIADKIDKNYERLFMKQWLQEMLKKASNANDFRGFAALQKQWSELIQLDKEDIPDSLLQEPIPVVMGDYADEEGATMTDAEAKLLRKNYIAKFSKVDTIDVQHTEV